MQWVQLSESRSFKKCLTFKVRSVLVGWYFIRVLYFTGIFKKYSQREKCNEDFSDTSA
jgi:hypothetical protein